MEWLFWILFFACILAFIVYQCITAHIEWEKRKMLGFMKETPLLDDCIEANRQMWSFLNDRYWGIGHNAFSDVKTGMDGNFFTLIESHDIPDLIRYVHLFGCHIKIEAVADHDIEDPKNTREVLEEFHTDLRKARDARYERKYRR